MKKLLALILSVCMILSTFTAVTVFAETENRDIAPESTVEAATDGYEDNDADNMFDGDLDTYYMAGKVDINGANYSTSSNFVWIKLAEHEKITRIETTFGSQADRKAMFGNGGGQNVNFYMWLTDATPDEAVLNGTNDIEVPEGKTAYRVWNKFSNQSANATMNVDIDEETAFTYLAIWGPFSSGLCISDLKIYADAEKKDVIPPGATVQIVEKQIAPVGAAFTSNDISNAANVADNIVDGDNTTMAIADGFGRGLYVDLGDTYEITKIEVTYPSETEISSFIAANGIETDDVTKMNTGMYVKIGESADGLSGNDCVNWGTRINAGTSTVKGDKVTYQYKYDSSTYKYDTSVGLKDMGKFRYISFVPSGSGTPLAVAEIKVYGMVEEVVGGLVQVNKNVATADYGATAEFGTWGYGEFNYENPGYEASKALDSDPSTIGLGACTYNDGNNHYSGNIIIVDLGQAREVTKVNLTWPTKAQNDDAKLAIGSKMTNNMNQSGVVFLTNSYPVASEVSDVNYTGSGVSLYGGSGLTSQTTLINTDGGSYKYACIFVPYSCGLSIADIEVYANIMEEPAPAEKINVAEGKQVYSNANNAEVAGYSKSMTYEMNAVDGKANTIFAGTTYAINSGDTDINFETVIDLGGEYQISGVKFTPYGGETTSIYGSNSYRFDDLEVIASDVATTDGAVQEYSVANKTYRYIVVDRISAEEGALLGIRDIEVYAEIPEDEVEAATAYTAGVKVGLNGDVYHTGSIRFGGAKEKMNDGIYDHGQDAEGTLVLDAASGTSRYAIMDLGAAYNISAVALSQALGCTGFNNSNFKVVATNDEITESTDLTTVEWTELATGYAYTDVNSKYLLPIEVSNDYSFRYVGIKGASGMGIPIREMDVYTSAQSYDFGTYTAFASGRDVIVNFSSSETSGIDSAKILVASYDANGVLINLVMDDLAITWGNGGEASKTLSGAIASGAVTKKVFIFEDVEGAAPLANSITL